MKRRGVKITLVTCLVVLVGLFVCLLWPANTTPSKTEVSVSEIGGEAASAALQGGTLTLSFSQVNALLETYVEPGVSLSEGSCDDTCWLTLPVHMGPFTIWVQGEAAFTMQNGEGTVTVQSLWAGALPLSPDLVLPLLPLPDSVQATGRTLKIDPPRLSVPGLPVSVALPVETVSIQGDSVQIQFSSLPSVAGDLLRQWLGL
ncbi:MAG TPA: hypothetical protein H9691_03075 [Firmicutes bacterium]|nr:hypothetical protein [Bacillota bacterium]